MKTWLKVTGISMGVGMIGSAVYSLGSFIATTTVSTEMILVVGAISTGLSLCGAATYHCISSLFNDNAEFDKIIRKNEKEISKKEEEILKQEEELAFIENQLLKTRNEFDRLTREQQQSSNPSSSNGNFLANTLFSSSQKKSEKKPRTQPLSKTRDDILPPSVQSTRQQRLFTNIFICESRLQQVENSCNDVESALIQLEEDQDTQERILEARSNNKKLTNG